MKFSIFILAISLALITSNFDLKLLNTIIKQTQKENVIISPLSLFQSISLVSNGAKGQTQSQLIEFIEQKDLLTSALHSSQIEEQISNTKGLLSANAVMSKFSPSKEFVTRCKGFKATVSQLVSAKQVNDWCSENTKGKITNLIDTISNMDMIILNAIYFKGIWLNKFDKANTKPGIFHSSLKGDQEVQMMHIKLKANYYGNNKVQMIELPYTEENVSTVIVLPAANVEINDFTKDFDMNDLRKLKTGRSDVKLTIPKFELTYQTTFNDVMKQLGVIDAFNAGKADFSNITEHMKLFISEVIQKTYIKFDEEGTEAAAVTAIQLKSRSMPFPRREPVMIVNRPFLLIIRHKQIEESKLFIAKIANIDK